MSRWAWPLLVRRPPWPNCAITLPFGPTAAERTRVNQPPPAATSTTVMPSCRPSSWTLSFGLRAASRTLSASGRAAIFASKSAGSAASAVVAKVASPEARTKLAAIVLIVLFIVCPPLLELGAS